MTARSCEVCDGPLAVTGAAVTGVCMACRGAGSRFMANWGADLITRGAPTREAADVLGVRAETLRARMRDYGVTAAVTR